MKTCTALACLILSFILTSCSSSGRASMQYRSEFPDGNSYNSKFENYYLKSYLTNIQTTTYIGKPMLRVEGFTAKRTEIVRKGIVFTPATDHYLFVKYINKLGWEKETVIHLEARNYPIHFSTTIEGTKYYIVETVSNGSKTKWGLLLKENNELETKYICDEELDHYFKVQNMRTSIDKPNYNSAIEGDESNHLTDISRTDVNYELIYSGLNKVAINLTYREYTGGNMARTPFFQNISYEPESKQIRFRDTIIAIDDISNEQITYRVLQDGLPPSPQEQIVEKIKQEIRLQQSKKALNAI